MNEVSILYILAFLTICALVVVVLPAFILGVLYEFAGDMEADFRRSMDSIRQRIRHNSATIQDLLRESQHFPQGPDALFGVPLERSNHSIGAAVTRMRAVRAQYRGLNQDAPASKAPGQSLGQKVRLGVGWASFWLQGLALRYQANQLDQKTSQAQRDFNQVLGVIDRVRQEVDQAFQSETKAETLLSNLMQYNLRGALFEHAVTSVKRLQQVSRQLPASYRSGTTYTPVRAADVDVGQVKSVFQRAQTLSKGYANHIQQFEDWQKQVDDLQNSLTGAQQALVQLYNIHSRVPKNLDIHELIDRIFKTNRQARRLVDIASHPDVAAIPQTKQSCLTLKQEAQVLQHELEQAIQLHTRWKNVFEQAGQAINQLKGTMDEQEARQDSYPLRWGQTREEYKLISEQLKSIDDHTYKISARQMQQDITACAQILRRAGQRRSHCAKKADLRRRLLGAWVDLGSVFETRWIAEKRQLDADVRRYSAENWDSSLIIQSFLADGLQIFENIRQVIPADKKSPIPEGQLDELLSQSHQSLNRLSRYQNRVEKIHIQLKRVWEAERQSDKILNPMLKELETALAQFDRLGQRRMRMDDLEMQFRQELAQAKARGLALGTELNRRESGLVFDKRKDIQAWAQAAANAYRQMARTSGQQITQHREGIRSRLGELQRIALLPGDPLVLNANRALALPERLYPQDISINLDDPQTIHQKMEDTGAQIEKNLTKRATFKQIDDELEGVLTPVRDLAGQVQEILAEFRGVAQSAQALDHGDRWPPTFIKIEAIKKSIAHLKLRHDEVVRTSTRANLQSNYAALRRESLAALQNLRADVRTAEVRDQTVRDAAERVQALIRAKRAMIVNYSNRPETAARAPELLQELDKHNRRWAGLTGGGYRRMSYNEILRILSELEVRLGDIQ